MDHSLTLSRTEPQSAVSPDEVDLRLLVTAAGQGDAKAFDELYRRYSHMVHGVLLARVGPTEADDLLQDVFLHAWRRLPALRDPEAFGGWLAAMARHRAIDALRGRPLIEPLVDTGRQASAHADLRAAQALAAIRTLPEAYREPLLMRLVEGMTGPEIADRTGLTPGSVRVNLCRGMKLLREQLSGDRHGR